MENLTFKAEFNILAFSTEKYNKVIVFSIFSLVYLVGVFMNVIIITVVFTNHHLHSPMYLFLCNLSFVDIFFTSTTVPNLLYMILSGNNMVSLKRCITQLYLFYLASSFEDILLTTMAYDRYVAICKPLHYHSILSKKMCTLLLIVMWIAGGLNSLIFTIPTSNMIFCRSRTIRQFFCEAKAMAAIACSGVDIFYTCFYTELLTVGTFLVVCILLSYAKVIGVIMAMTSKVGRKKAYSTCSSHVTVFSVYYGTALVEYLVPATSNSNIVEQTMTAMYAVVTPALNPLIYSLRNKELKKAVCKLIRKQL